MGILSKIKRSIDAFNDVPKEISVEALRDVLDESIPLVDTLRRHRLIEEPIGDGNAVFLGDGTHEEFIDQEREDKGTKSWYDRLKRLV